MSTAQCGFEAPLGLENALLPLNDTNRIMSDTLILNKNASSSMFNMWHYLSRAHAKSVKEVQKWEFDVTLAYLDVQTHHVCQNLRWRVGGNLYRLVLIKENDLRKTNVLKLTCTRGGECGRFKERLKTILLHWKPSGPAFKPWALGLRGCDSHNVFKGFSLPSVENIVYRNSMFGFLM